MKGFKDFIKGISKIIFPNRIIKPKKSSPLYVETPSV